MTLAIKRIHNLPPHLSYVSTLRAVFTLVEALCGVVVEAPLSAPSPPFLSPPLPPHSPSPSRPPPLRSRPP